jgi:hypothetical protein
MLKTFKKEMPDPAMRKFFIGHIIAIIVCIFLFDKMLEMKQEDFAQEMIPKILVENEESITYQYITRNIINGPTLHTFMVSKKFFSMKHKEYLIALTEAKQGV